MVLDYTSSVSSSGVDMRETKEAVDLLHPLCFGMWSWSIRNPELPEI